MTNLQSLTKSQLIEKLNQANSRDHAEAGPDVDNLRLDLEVHQIELEMQNRELRDKQRDLELARDKYADLYEFAPLGYLTLDGKGIIREINLTATAMLNVTRSQLLNKPFSIFLNNGASVEFFQALRDTIEGDTEQSLELKLQRNGTPLFDTRLYLVPLHNDNHAVRVAMIDISTQKRAESEARENHEKLLHASRLSTLGELSSGIAHEVSQPIASIAVYAEALQKMAKSGQIDMLDLKEVAAELSDQTQRARLILDRVRAFSRRDAPCQSPQDILHVIDEAVRFVKPILKGHKIELMVHQSFNPAMVNIDRVQIIQVLINLLQNAVEAMSETPLTERKIDIRVIMPAQSQVEVEILDQGVGVPSEAMGQLFMPFYTTRDEGLGLGLSLSHSIIQSHGGRLWVEHNHPRGAIFHFTLPKASDM